MGFPCENLWQGILRECRGNAESGIFKCRLGSRSLCFEMLWTLCGWRNFTQQECIVSSIASINVPKCMHVFSISNPFAFNLSNFLLQHWSPINWTFFVFLPRWVRYLLLHPAKREKERERREIDWVLCFPVHKFLSIIEIKNVEVHRSLPPAYLIFVDFEYLFSSNCELKLCIFKLCILFNESTFSHTNSAQLITWVLSLTLDQAWFAGA